MRTITLTEARRQLAELAERGEAVELTRRGLPLGTLRVYAEPKVDRARAVEAAKRIREIGAKYKPSKKHGGAKAIRDVRDGR